MVAVDGSRRGCGRNRNCNRLCRSQAGGGGLQPDGCAVPVRIGVLILLTTLSGVVHAAVKVAILPGREPGQAEIQLEKALIEAVRSNRNLELVNVSPQGRLIAPRGGPVESRLDPNPVA